jgi:hypothetical protein
MGKMRIEPFGDIEFHYKEKEWFGIVQNVSSNNTIELSIGAENKNIDISDKIEKIKLFAKNYNSCQYRSMANSALAYLQHIVKLALTTIKLNAQV